MPKTIFEIHREKLEVIMERVFNAPRERIFKVYTNPGFIPQWWGPSALATVVEKMDVRPGGSWRYIQKYPDGRESAFYGEYKKISPPSFIASTFNFEGAPSGHELVETMALTELEANITKATGTAIYRSTEDLQEMVEAGMESEAISSWEHLAALVETPA